MLGFSRKGLDEPAKGSVVIGAGSLGEQRTEIEVVLDPFENLLIDTLHAHGTISDGPAKSSKVGNCALA